MSKTSEEAIDFLFPLTRHTRTEKVTAELAALGRLPRRQVLARTTERGEDGGLARETLVAVVRGFVRAGDKDTADTVLTALIDRLRPALKARARQWSTLSPMDFSDAEDDAVFKLMAYVRSTESQEAFWECNFAHCFKFRVDSVFQSTARRRGDAVSLTASGADGAERDRAAEIADPEGETAFGDIETREAVQALSRAVPGFAEYLYLHEQGHTDREIAAKTGVTDRTLRNRKEKARQFLTALKARP